MEDWKRFNADTRTFTLEIGEEDDIYVEAREVTVGSKKEVCPRCDGEGSHLHEAIGSHAYTPEEFYEDPEFAEGYFRGAYDVNCDLCGGLRVINVPYGRDKKEEAEIALFNAQEKERWDNEWECRAEQEAERRFGC